MSRHILDEQYLHPAIRLTVAGHHRDTVEAVQEAILEHRVVVIGMKGNPVVTKARNALQAQNVDYTYLEYGSYLSQWRRRNALKMWSGWPTFPMIFLDGVLVGGYRDLQALIDSSELKKTLDTQRRPAS